MKAVLVFTALAATLALVRSGNAVEVDEEDSTPSSASAKRDMKRKFKHLKSQVEEMLQELRNTNHAILKHADRTRVLSHKIGNMTRDLDDLREENLVLKERLQLMEFKRARRVKKTKLRITEVEKRLSACSCSPSSSGHPPSVSDYDYGDDYGESFSNQWREMKRQQMSRRRKFSSGGSGSGRSRWRDRGPLSSGGGSSSSRAGGGKGKKKEQVATLYEEDLWDESTPRGSSQIFITAGSHRSSEIIDISKYSRCIRPADYPLQVEGAVAAFINGRPMVCGGRKSIEEYYNSCYSYHIFNNSWTRTSSMMERRFQATAVMINSRQWWITGGFSGDRVYNSTEIYEVGKGFSRGPGLPAVTFQHCLVKVNATHIFLVGGYPYNRDAWMFDVFAQRWSSQKPITHLRDAPHCATVERYNGKIEVIVAGGSLPGSELSTEIFSVTDNRWRGGPNLPKAVIFAQSLPYRNTLVIMGGRPMSASGDMEGELDTVYQYDAYKELWKMMDRRLKRPRMSFVAVNLPEHYKCSALEQKKLVKSDFG